VLAVDAWYDAPPVEAYCDVPDDDCCDDDDDGWYAELPDELP
jgi:hypothetical protein